MEKSNNCDERSIKTFVNDRANTPKGTRGSAVIFSLFQVVLEN